MPAVGLHRAWGDVGSPVRREQFQGSMFVYVGGGMRQRLLNVPCGAGLALHARLRLSILQDEKTSWKEREFGVGDERVEIELG
jgi:hypothetical protein